MDDVNSNGGEKDEFSKEISHFNADEKSDFPSTITFLERKLEALEKLIEKFSGQEMTLNEMEGESSAYLKQDYVVRKYLECWKKYMLLCRKNDGRNKVFKKLQVTKSNFPQINEAVKKHLCAKYKFPDYPEIYCLVSEANKQLNLNLNDATIKYESFELFYEIGSQLQKHRKKAVAKSMKLCASAYPGPDESSFTDHSLTDHLQSVYKTHDHEMENIFRKYTELDISTTASVVPEVQAPSLLHDPIDFQSGLSPPEESSDDSNEDESEKSIIEILED